MQLTIIYLALNPVIIRSINLFVFKHYGKMAVEYPKWLLLIELRGLCDRRIIYNGEKLQIYTFNWVEL